jgi:hypothetical protein
MQTSAETTLAFAVGSFRIFTSPKCCGSDYFRQASMQTRFAQSVASFRFFDVRERSVLKSRR